MRKWDAQSLGALRDGVLQSSKPLLARRSGRLEADPGMNSNGHHDLGSALPDRFGRAGPGKRRIGLQLFAMVCKIGLAERCRDRLRHGTLLSRRLWRAHRRTLTASVGYKSIFASSELRRLAAASKRRWDREGQEWTVNHSRKRATEWATCLITPVATPPR